MSEQGLKPILRQGTVDIITDQLRAQIVSGAFAQGTQLGEANLAQQLNTSRGPVREALQRLMQEGLIVGVHNRGVFVKVMTEQDVTDIMLARTAIEKTASVHLLRHHQPEVLAELTSIVGTMRDVAASDDWSAMIDVDMEFHRVVVDSRGSSRLSGIYRTLIMETRMSLAMLDEAYPVREEIPDEHQQLIDAIRGADELALYDAIDHHMDHAARMRQTALSKSEK
ncbi:DNA-binding transcriptional regulator, GntR family [Agreia bicolorata]|uniref:DNA-binding transcriptional regulator, GntR family n=1 Tax=Agreia bicolorata TaxID=110935 RepID=A0A1T4WPZ9_9MICO|nr:GntR family transcriptional regulator [Agreia bicolorata]SKA79423.1 DNA-binding transcriptional regulator, GntR family [Agreia bicolorata]